MCMSFVSLVPQVNQTTQPCSSEKEWNGDGTQFSRIFEPPIVSLWWLCMREWHSVFGGKADIAGKPKPPSERWRRKGEKGPPSHFGPPPWEDERGDIRENGAMNEGNFAAACHGSVEASLGLFPFDTLGTVVNVATGNSSVKALAPVSSSCLQSPCSHQGHRVNLRQSMTSASFQTRTGLITRTRRQSGAFPVHTGGPGPSGEAWSECRRVSRGRRRGPVTSADRQRCPPYVDNLGPRFFLGPT